MSILRLGPESGSGVQVKARKAESPFSQVGVVYGCVRPRTGSKVIIRERPFIFKHVEKKMNAKG